jgi:recombination protein RecA
MTDTETTPVPAAPNPVLDRVRGFIAKVNESYDAGVMELGGKFQALNISRFSTGILTLDCALGGGWPFSRVSVIAGEYSTGKTLMAIKACASIEEYDHVTKLHRSRMPADRMSEFQPGVALVVDLEGAFDLSWAKKNGFNPDHHAVARPETAEQAIDMVTAAVHDNVFDLIVVDSIAAMTPSKELDETSEKWQMGLAARLTNKAMRRWNAKLAKTSQADKGVGGPSILCLNQFRIDLNKSFGDPRTMPNGKGQTFCASVIVYTKSASLEDADGKSGSEAKEMAYGTYGGVVHKNKTYVPMVTFKYQMALRDMEGEPTGTVDNLKQLLALGKKYNLIRVEKDGPHFGERKWGTQKALVADLAEDEKLRRLLWRSIVKQATSTVV